MTHTWEQLLWCSRVYHSEVERVSSEPVDTGLSNRAWHYWSRRWSLKPLVPWNDGGAGSAYPQIRVLITTTEPEQTHTQCERAGASQEKKGFHHIFPHCSALVALFNRGSLKRGQLVRLQSSEHWQEQRVHFRVKSISGETGWSSFWFRVSMNSLEEKATLDFGRASGALQINLIKATST